MVFKKNGSLYLVSSLILLVFFLNGSFELSEAVNTIGILLALILTIVLVIRFKTILLLSLSAAIPVSIPVAFGNTKISAPAEFICVVLGGYFFVQLLRGYRIHQKLIQHPVTIFILLDLCWMFITTCTSQDPVVSFKRLIIRSLFYISFFYFYYELFKNNRKNITRVFLLQCVAFLVPITSAAIKHYYLGFSSTGSLLTSSPYYNDHTMFGAALVFFIPFLFISSFRSQSLSTRAACAALLLIFLASAFLTYSRAAWLSLIIAAALAVLFYFRISLKWIGIIAATIGLFLISNKKLIDDKLRINREVSHSSDITTHFKSISNIKTDASNKERINRWKCALRMFADKPLFGFGPGTYQFYYGNYQQRSDMTSISTFSGLKGHAHSEYLNYLSETGLAGLIIFLCIIFSASIRAIRIMRDRTNPENSWIAVYTFTGLLTFFIHAFFNGFIEFDKLAMPVFMSYATIVCLDLHHKNTEVV